MAARKKKRALGKKRVSEAALTERALIVQYINRMAIAGEARASFMARKAVRKKSTSLLLNVSEHALRARECRSLANEIADGRHREPAPKPESASR